MGRSCANLPVSNTKVISRSFQGQTGKKLKICTFNRFQACQWCRHLLERTDGDTFLDGYHFTHILEKSRAVLILGG